MKVRAGDRVSGELEWTQASSYNIIIVIIIVSSSSSSSSIVMMFTFIITITIIIKGFGVDAGQPRPSTRAPCKWCCYRRCCDLLIGIITINSITIV